jgi:hypothetical protein
MSGAQMVSSLRQVYSVPPKVGGEMVKTLVETTGKRPVAAITTLTEQGVSTAAPTTNAKTYQLLREFAKREAPGAARGEKIWVELNEAGKPVRVVTPGQAGAVTRRGGTATWVEKLWD